MSEHTPGEIYLGTGMLLLDLTGKVYMGEGLVQRVLPCLKSKRGHFPIALVPNTDGWSGITPKQRANAERLARCWNSHDALVAALEAAQEAMDVAGSFLAVAHDGDLADGDYPHVLATAAECVRLAHNARAAIALAKKEA